MAQRTNVLVAIESEAAYARAMLNGMVDYAERHGRWELIHDRQFRLNEDLLERYPNVQGLVLEGKDTYLLNMLAKYHLPLVAAGSHPEGVQVPCVMTNNEKVSAMAAEHFWNLGLEHFGYVGRFDNWHSQDREQHFVDLLNQEDLECRVFHFASLPSQTRRDMKKLEQLRQWLFELPKPIGIWASGDLLGRIVIGECRHMDIDVPSEVAVLGIDNDELECRLASPELSSIEHGTYQVGYESARLLDKLIRAEAVTDDHVVVDPIGIVPRRSTDTLAIDDPDVKSAIQFVRRHGTEPIKVEDVVDHVLIARRALEVRFKRILGRTIHQELTRVRIEKAKALLGYSTLGIPEISMRCGFNYMTHFCRIFKQKVGVSPAVYQRKVTGPLGNR